MSITYAEAIGTLKAMFPNWDDETLGTILVSNNYHVERTIETVLAMSGDTDVSSPPPAPAPAPVHHAPSSSTSTSRSRQQAQAAPPAPDPRYRGRKCSLPEDFLRAPGHEFRILADEELALMLQNELFQREVRAMFGDDFVREATRQTGSSAAGRQPSTTGTTRSNITGAGSGSGSGSGSRRPSTAGAQQAGDTDLGIMKSLSSMGTAARRNLSLLAARFSSGQQQQTRNGETGNAREFKPLVDNNGDDDDEDVEFVTFDSRENNRSRHVLQDTADTGNDSENPLFQQGFATRDQTRMQRDI